ncbi:alpha/beta-type small acid-soluble spore protein [Gorillibacterium massiliense]|uniref:alpha/beta-type small acid-soluble spore protein n=1 Tax=Gorillibacterium massiliense TaxID=1280390 RepID=UPI0004B7ADBE|nr:alpha/beta-type small acid-soluble spore protein [Gorillibacterium massiliense]
MAKGKKLVPESKQVLDQMKYEIAAELGLPVGQGYNAGADTEFAGELGAMGSSGSGSKDYWGHLASRDAGSVGGTITKRLIEKAEESLFSLS